MLNQIRVYPFLVCLSSSSPNILNSLFWSFYFLWVFEWEEKRKEFGFGLGFSFVGLYIIYMCSHGPDLLHATWFSWRVVDYIALVLLSFFTFSSPYFKLNTLYLYILY